MRFLENLEGKCNHLKKLGGGMMKSKKPLEIKDIVIRIDKRLKI